MYQGGKLVHIDPTWARQHNEDRGDDGLMMTSNTGQTCVKSRDRPKFGFGFGYGDIFSFGYCRNREVRFRPTFGYGRNYDTVSA